MSFRERFRAALRGRVERWLAAFLTRPVRRYERHGWNDLDALERHVRKGDVLLSQGDQRISAIIRYLTQSHWSHATLYIGDELLLRGGEAAERMRNEFGDGAEHLVIDALPQGVIARPLAAYADYNIRLCRPRLAPDDLKTVLDGAIGAIGWQYDLRNLVDLARHYLPAELVPHRLRSRGPRLGSGTRATVICTSLIGGLFDQVGYPVQATEAPPEPPAPVVAPGLLGRLLGGRPRRPSGRFRRRHPTFLAPCDFDRSPYFDIVKFNVMADRDFDYRLIHWESEHAERERS